MLRTNLFGAVSFELFGQLHNVVGEEPGDRDAFFAECIAAGSPSPPSPDARALARRAPPPDVRILDVSAP